jgi:hypothetical protein
MFVLMDAFLQSKTLENPGVSVFPSQKSTHTNNNALVFNRSATGVDKEDFDKNAGEIWVERYWAHDFKSIKIIRLIITAKHKFYKFFTENPGVSVFPSQKSTHTNNNALVFNRSATGVDKEDFDKKFSLAKTLTNKIQKDNSVNYSGYI